MLQLQMMLQADEELQNRKGCVPGRKKLSRNLASSYEQKSQYFHLTCQNIPFVLNAFL